MHKSAYNSVEKFKNSYLSNFIDTPLRVLDLGAQSVNGCTRPIFNVPKWTYIGLDVSSGNNVDIVLKSPYDWSEVESESADVLISVSTLEHVEYFWLTMQEIARVLRPGGLCCIIVPSAGPEHRYPVDCWRYFPDGLRAMANYVNMEVLKAETDWEGSLEPDSTVWHDSVLICRKPSQVTDSSLSPYHPHIYRRPAKTEAGPLHLVCVSNNNKLYKKYVESNANASQYAITLYDNELENIGIAERYNHFIEYCLPDLADTWISFIHHDFEFDEDPMKVLINLDSDHIYGPIGAAAHDELHSRDCLAISRSEIYHLKHRHHVNTILGHIKCSKDLSETGEVGDPFVEPIQVDTLDCCCIIIHSSLITKHRLRFDKNLKWHLYSEDLSLTAKKDFNIKTKVIPIACGHYGKGEMNMSFVKHLNYFTSKHPEENFGCTVKSLNKFVFKKNGSREIHLSSRSILYFMHIMLDKIKLRMKIS